MKTKTTLPRHPWRQLALIDPRLDQYTWVGWLKIHPSNLFILPFAVTVLLVYAGFTRGLHLGSVLSSLVVGLPVGYLIGLMETHSQALQRVCKRRQFATFLLTKTLRLSLLFSLLFTLLIPALLLIDMQFHYSMFDVGLASFLKQQFFEVLAISLVVAGLVNFFLEINRKLGPGVLLNLITGRYHTPQSQERTFLFLDVNNSTPLAESLGDVKFSEFLQDFFYDINDTISQYGGKVYQYVGDEVVVSWKSRPGFVDNRAVECYLAIQERIREIAAYYRTTYGCVPEFKGGIHRGTVVVAEVGKTKSEIAYHGDVLNTTSRIANLCATLEHDLLVSDKVCENMVPDPTLAVEPLGSFYLKGKSRGVTLYAISRAATPDAATAPAVSTGRNAPPELNAEPSVHPAVRNDLAVPTSSLQTEEWAESAGVR
ncbi:MAG: adenylate/guanylate cyclase domain-containing protein [Ferruginibacter sp.]|nr:adenylate/guanylate cyclase domain-containing protein [Cytophagales bacterium]